MKKISYYVLFLILTSSFPFKVVKEIFINGEFWEIHLCKEIEVSRQIELNCID